TRRKGLLGGPPDDHLAAARSSATRTSVDRPCVDPAHSPAYPGVVSVTHEDIVAVGGDLEPATLVAAYRRGVFPWPVDGLPLLWFCPRERAVLDFASLHVGPSLAPARRQTPFRITVDAPVTR